VIIVGKEAIQCCLDQAAAKGALALDVSTIGSTGFDDGQVSSRPSAIGRIIVNQLWGNDWFVRGIGDCEANDRSRALLQDNNFRCSTFPDLETRLVLRPQWLRQLSLSHRNELASCRYHPLCKLTWLCFLPT
jgi:hypothetical protein